ncbi:MAG: nucleotidyltransferase domain-containing protein [Deltaproteobacteria bacterium]|nr:nucleotidyltransferase domain-containing protein [Deltaproteobacteria bacterium]
MSLIPFQEEIVSALRQAEPTIKRIFLFGSRVRRKIDTRASDIDIGIIAEEKLTFLQLARINDALDELHTLHTIDVVDFTGRTDDFAKQAIRFIEVLHERC